MESLAHKDDYWFFSEKPDLICIANDYAAVGYAVITFCILLFAVVGCQIKKDKDKAWRLAEVKLSDLVEEETEMSMLTDSSGVTRRK